MEMRAWLLIPVFSLVWGQALAQQAPTRDPSARVPPPETSAAPQMDDVTLCRRQLIMAHGRCDEQEIGGARELQRLQGEVTASEAQKTTLIEWLKAAQAKK
jgi:hypothetical protein